MALPSPDQAKGWTQFALGILERGGPVAGLILGLCAIGMIYGLYQELGRVHEVSLRLFEKMESCYQAQLELARHCATPQEGR